MDVGKILQSATLATDCFGTPSRRNTPEGECRVERKRSNGAGATLSRSDQMERWIVSVGPAARGWRIERAEREPITIRDIHQAIVTACNLAGLRTPANQFTLSGR